MNVRDRPGVAASEIIGERQILARVDIEATGHFRILDEFDAIGLWTAWRGRGLICGCGDFERHTQWIAERIRHRLPCCRCRSSAPDGGVVVKLIGGMPAKQGLCAGSRLRVHREPVIGWHGGCALLAEGLSGIETEIINVCVEADRAWDARVIKLFGYTGIKTLIILAGAEGLAPERGPGM